MVVQKGDKWASRGEVAAAAGSRAKVPAESERGVSMGGKERCEAEVGQMVADNEGVEV